MKTRSTFFSLTVIMVMLATLVFQVTPAYAATQSIGGTAVAGNLRVTVQDNGAMEIAQYTGALWQENVFGVSAKGSTLCVATTRYDMGGNSSWTPGAGGTVATWVSNTGGAGGTGTIVTTWTAGGMTIVQNTSYTDGNQYYTITWDVTNNSGGDINDLRFFNGQDTLLAGSDEGNGWWDAGLGAHGSIGVTHPTNGQQMWLQPVSEAPFNYESQEYYTSRANVDACALDGTVTAAIHDNGYALEFRHATLANGATWTVTTEEHFTPATPAPAVGIAGNGSFGDQPFGTTSAPTTFTVTNTGTADLILGTLQVFGAEFTTSADTCSGATVAPTSACTFNVSFTPSGVGWINGSLWVHSNASTSPDNISLDGNGTAPLDSTVTFDGNGADGGSMADQTASAPTALNLNAFTRTGHTFAGWGTTSGGPVVYANGANYDFSADITLFAQWTVNQYTITFDSAGGSPVASITQDYGTPVTAPADPTRTGYTFAGWNPAVPATMPLGGAALTAQWTLNSYTVSFDAQGGSPTPGDQTVAYGALVTNPGAPTRAGHLFNGWFTASSGGTQWNFATDTMGAGDMTLFAQWTAYTEQSATFTSVANYDGYVFESGENTGVGILANAVSPFGMVGDHMQDRQMRSLLHFDTSSLPDNAVITNITLSIKRLNVLGAPFTSLGTLQADIASPFFGPEMALKPADFQALPVFAAAGAFNPVPATGNWYSAGFDPASFSSLNLAGTTQFRLAFSIEDDDDMRPDLLWFYSGNFRTATYRPVLVITYYVP